MINDNTFHHDTNNIDIGIFDSLARDVGAAIPARTADKRRNRQARLQHAAIPHRRFIRQYMERGQRKKAFGQGLCTRSVAHQPRHGLEQDRNGQHTIQNQQRTRLAATDGGAVQRECGICERLIPRRRRRRCRREPPALLRRLRKSAATPATCTQSNWL